MSSRQSRARMQRSAARHPVLFPCHVIRERDLEVVAKVALDLSAGGLQVLTGAKVLTGEPVQVTFRAPETGRWLSLQGTVVRVLHGRRPGEWGRRLGIAFEEMPREHRDRLLDATFQLGMALASSGSPHARVSAAGATA